MKNNFLKPHERLKDLIYEARVDRKTVSTGTGINYFTLSKLISGERTIQDDDAQRLITYFSSAIGRKIPNDFLNYPERVDPRAGITKIPVYEYRMNRPTLLDESNKISDRYISLAERGEGDYFWLYSDQEIPLGNRVVSDVHVLCKIQSNLNDGETGVFMYKGSATIKMLQRVENRYVLYAMLPGLPPILADPSEAKIVARVVALEVPL